MSIHISDDKKVIVKVPFCTSLSNVQKFVMEKKDWIIKQLKKLESQNELASSMPLLTEQDIKEIRKRRKL